MTVWTLYLRDAAFNRVAEIEDYQKFEAISRFNGVGTFTLDMDLRVNPTLELTEPGVGIILTRDDTVLFSGPVLTRKRSRDVKSNTLSVSGTDDNVWLQRRLAHPSPTESNPPYTISDYDIRGGQCSLILRQYVNVNAASGAITARRIPSLILDPVNPPLGTTVVGRARYQVLLDLLIELALTGGGLGFDIVQSGTDLVFTVYQPTDKSNIIQFSVEIGNVFKHEYNVTAPSTTYLYIGGGGEGTARTIKEGVDSARQLTWGRIEKFQDRRDTTDDVELTDETIKTLAEDSEKTELTIEPIDVPGQQYKTHYDLGDKVSVIIDGSIIQELIREVTISLEPKGPQRVIPKIGSPGQMGIIGLFTKLREANRRIADLERRR